MLDRNKAVKRRFARPFLLVLNLYVLGIILGLLLPTVSLAASQSMASLYDNECQPVSLPEVNDLVDFDEVRERYSLQRYQGISIARVKVFNVPVFNLQDPQENNAFTRFINRIHFPTRPYVVHRQILFESGDELDPRVITESERILRSNSFLSDAVVLPLQLCDDGLDLVVVIRDLWTMSPKFYISRTGGFTKYGIKLEDNNLFGTGDSLSFHYENDRERDTATIDFGTRNLFGSRFALNTSYQDATDGFIKKIEIEKPFYSLDASHAYGIRLNQNIREESLQQLNQDISRFDHASNDYEVFAGLSSGLVDGYTRRYVFGFTQSEDTYRALDTTSVIPDDRLLAYPWVMFSLAEDKFAIYRNLTDLHRTEDISVGLQWQALFGYADERFGSDLTQYVFSLSYSDFPLVMDRHLLKTRIASKGFWDREDEQLENAINTLELSYYWLRTTKQRLFAGLRYDYGRNLSSDELLVLGGDEGLRGYPSEFLLGDRRLLMNVENRYFFDTHWLNIVRFAGVLFFDIGRTQSSDATADVDSGWIKSAGIGIRMNSSKTNISKIIHMDLAFPLDQQDLVGDYEFRIFGSANF